MGVRSESYLLWGWLLPREAFDDLTDDEQEAICDLPGGYHPKVGEIARLLGMDGDYVAVGKVIDCADDEGDGFSPRKLSALPEQHLGADAADVLAAFKVDDPGEPSYILLTHYH